MAVEGDAVEWQVVSKKKTKGGKSKQKQAEVLEHPPTESLTNTESRKEELLYGSPSMRSIRSEVSTKDTEMGGDEQVSLPTSPNLVSSWSETSTTMSEESCSLQASSSGASLEAAQHLEAIAALDRYEKVPEPTSAKATTLLPSKVKPAAKGVAPSGHISLPLSHAIRQACQKEEVTIVEGAPQLKNDSSSIATATVARKGGRKAVGQRVAKVTTGNVNNIAMSRITEPDRQVVKAAKHHANKVSAPVPEREDVAPLGSTWIHNGRRDEAAEWRLLIFQPLWSCKSLEVPNAPVSVRTVDAGAHLVIKQTFLNLEPTFDSHPRRARSLDSRLKEKLVTRL